MYQFTITPNYENWTANGLLKQYAEQNGIERVFTDFGEQLLHIDGVLYKYDHIKSIYENPVTVYLKEYQPPQPHYGTPGWYRQQIEKQFHKNKKTPLNG